MENNIIYIYLLIVLNLYLIAGVNVTLPTNFTLSELSNKNEKVIPCKQPEDCPFGNICTGTGCYYGEFICFEKGNEPCLLLNTTIYNSSDEVFVSSYKKDLSSDEKKPILKTCDKTQVDSKDCKTEKCEVDNDCLSGKCYSNNCIVGESDIYLCTGSHNDDDDISRLHCGKQAQMKCSKNEDCHSNRCVEGLCKNYLSDASQDYNGEFRKMLIFVAIGIILIIIILILLCCRSYKKEKNTINKYKK